MEQRLTGLVSAYGDTALVALALDAVETSQCERRDQSLPPSSNDWEVNPKTILTVLTYCYAVGIYNPEDVEDAIEEHPAVSYLAARKSPSAVAIRRYRREHRALLAQTLAGFLQGVWIVAEAGVDPTCIDLGKLSQIKDSANISAGLKLEFSRLAEDHLRLAVLWDGPAMHD